MQSLRIQDNKAFMQHLLLSGTFDAFGLVSAQVTTFCTFQISGEFIPGFLPETEALSAAKGTPPASETSPASATANRTPSYAPWRLVRPHVLDVIRGKNKPGSMRIVFRLSDDNMQKVLRSCGEGWRDAAVAGLFLNITYQHSGGEETITCIPGVSLRIFTLDKELEHTWDDLVQRYLKQAQIPFTLE